MTRLYSEVRNRRWSATASTDDNHRLSMDQRRLLKVHIFTASHMRIFESLLSAYIDEVEKAMEYIRETPDISNEEKKRFFKSANTNLGTSALCLSGGASFGYCMHPCSFKTETNDQGSVHPLLDHFGVVKAFIDQNLLPRVISGTSAGGLVAALICTYTDEELKELLVPELANRITACEDPFKVWFRRFWLTGARFDSATWARKVSTMGAHVG